MQGRYRPLLLEYLALALGGQYLPLADLTGCFVQSDRNAVQIAGPVLIRGPSEKVTNAERTESYEGRATPYPLRDTLSGGRNAVGLLAGAGDHARTGAGEPHCE